MVDEAEPDESLLTLGVPPNVGIINSEIERMARFWIAEWNGDEKDVYENFKKELTNLSKASYVLGQRDNATKNAILFGHSVIDKITY